MRDLPGDFPRLEPGVLTLTAGERVLGREHGDLDFLLEAGDFLGGGNPFSSGLRSCKGGKRELDGMYFSVGVRVRACTP